MKNNNLRKNCIIVSWVFFVTASILFSIFQWYCKYFGIRLQELLFTLASPKEGADLSFFVTYISYFIKYCLIPILCFLFIFLADKTFYKKLNMQISLKTKKKQIIWNVSSFFNIILMCTALIFFFVTVFQITKTLNIKNYIESKHNVTKIYEEHYISPKDVSITTENKRNLIYIYMESMENTYQDKINGGQQTTNYIPNLTELAKQNTSFKNTYNDANGFIPNYGAGWTMGAIFCTTTGLPFSFPINGNEMDTYKSFASGITNLGDILFDFGYQNEFLCGSNASFAGRRKYFEQHGNYKIFDYFTAIEKKYIEPDYLVWWGFEDEILYKIAKDEISALAKNNKPFNFTMLTVDTHHVGGYVCSNCKNKYNTQLENVVACADEQIGDFINWCKKQSWFENTTIIITGDHPRMDSLLVKNIEYTNRTVYECFINPVPEVQKKERLFVTCDIFPTILASMGFKIEGDRLGLGTNLFSNKQTLCEEMGFLEFENEIEKSSQYYLEHFK